MTDYGSLIAFYTYQDYLSNHYRCRFTINGVTFNCAEQAIMYTKAKLFGDHASAELILLETSPQKQKLLGRKVKEFVDEIWKAKRKSFYVQILMAKYQQNPGICEALLLTEDKILVEAAKGDADWGVGLSEDDPLILDRRNWRGENICGYGNMYVRDKLRSRS